MCFADWRSFNIKLDSALSTFTELDAFVLLCANGILFHVQGLSQNFLSLCVVYGGMFIGLNGRPRPLLWRVWHIE